MRILFMGDIVSEIGREMVRRHLPSIKREYAPHLIIANGENTTNGRGIQLQHYQELLQMGIHVFTSGNHIFDHKDAFDQIDEMKFLVRPANYPDGTKGQGYVFFQWNEIEIAIINVMGRTFMAPIDSPFEVIDKILEKISKRTHHIFVDFHAEATSEKIAMAWHLDGRVSAIVGTHTHVQTADERILPLGTATLTDVGMTGAYDGILGVEKEAVIQRFITQMPLRFGYAKKGMGQLNGVLIDIDRKTGKASGIQRIRLYDSIEKVIK